MPRFSCLHQPGGTPPSLNLTFPGVAPTGPLPPSVDFELTRQDEPKDFKVVLFTDPQPESDAEAQRSPGSRPSLRHIWVARLLAALPVGTHRVVVRAVTEYGDAVTGALALEVV